MVLGGCPAPCRPPAVWRRTSNPGPAPAPVPRGPARRAPRTPGGLVEQPSAASGSDSSRSRPCTTRQRAASSGRPSSSQRPRAPSIFSARRRRPPRSPGGLGRGRLADRVVQPLGEPLGLLGRGPRPARQRPASARTTARAEIASTDCAIRPARSQTSSARASSVSAPARSPRSRSVRAEPEERREGDLGPADLLGQLVGAPAAAARRRPSRPRAS